jgi:hypothetical protein
MAYVDVCGIFGEVFGLCCRPGSQNRAGDLGKEIFISSTSSVSKLISCVFSVEYLPGRSVTPCKHRNLLSTRCWGIQGDLMFFNCWIQTRAVEKLWNFCRGKTIFHNFSPGLPSGLVSDGAVLHSHR